MKVDRTRIQNYLNDIKSRALEIQKLLEKYKDQEILSEIWLVRGMKYLLIEIAEVMANALTHILVRDKGAGVTGYVETIIQSGEQGILSNPLADKLKPFFDFRNSLIHRYWVISDEKLLLLVRENYHYFILFIEEIEEYLKQPK